MDTPRPKGQPLRPIRVLLFSTLYPSAERPAHGIFVETRLRELLKTGEVDVRVIAPVPWFFSTHPRWGERARMAATPAQETRNGIQVVHPRYPLLPKVGMTIAPALLALACIAPIRQLQRDGFDFDLIDAHYYYPDGVAAAWLARHFKKPLAITARGTDLNLIAQAALPRRMILWAARQAQASIGVCKALMDVLRDMGVDPRKLHVMRNGVDLQRFQRVPAPELRARTGLQPGQGPLLLSVGHLIERKGHHLVIEALVALLPQHPDARAVIVGEGEERARLEALARRLGVADRVTLTGSLPQSELPRWYSAADVLVLASSREGWANVLLEAMACGTPVVATNIWGTPEVVASPDAGVLVGARTGTALAEGARDLLAQAAASAVTRTYAEGFSWDETSQAQLRLFRQMAAEHRATAPASRGVEHA
jgi:glycosyltransferase involved in cell wall biosynthesis